MSSLDDDDEDEDAAAFVGCLALLFALTGTVTLIWCIAGFYWALGVFSGFSFFVCACALAAGQKISK